MMGIQYARELRESAKHPDGSWKFWVLDKNGVEVLNPVWGPNLGPNEDAKQGWIQRFIDECQDQAHMTVHKEFLSTVLPDKFVIALKKATWTTLWTTYGKKENGTLEEVEKKGRARGREYSRETAVSPSFTLGNMDLRSFRKPPSAMLHVRELHLKARPLSSWQIDISSRVRTQMLRTRIASALTSPFFAPRL
jgi:hypothetical protein